MSHWLIEKSGTGIEKSGTGIEKSGTGIEKSGTGIEKSGTGIEKSGTGIRKGFLACSLAALTFASNINAAAINPNGELTLVVENGRLTVSWVLDGSVFVGFSNLNSAYTEISLLELAPVEGTSKLKIAGGGTGSDTEIAGGGTGSSTEIAGGGTGSASEIAGGGTGSSSEIAGGGTGSDTDIAGGGTGTDTDIAGGGTGDTILIAGGGTGSESIAITLPSGTQMRMEVALSCKTATVYVLDSDGYEVVSFENVEVVGDTGLCDGRGGQLDPADGFNPAPGGYDSRF